MKGRAGHPDSHRDYSHVRMRLADGIRGTNLAKTPRLELFRVKRESQMTLGGTSAENAGGSHVKTPDVIAPESQRMSGELGRDDAYLSQLECRRWSAKTPCPRVLQHIPHDHFLTGKC